MFKVYIVHEIGDYGLWDMTDAKVFSKFKDAEVYNEEYYKQHGYTLVITEWDVEQAKHNTYIHVMMITIEQYIDVYGKFELKYNNKQYKTIKI